MHLSRYRNEMVDLRHKMAALMPLLLPAGAQAAPAWSYSGADNSEIAWGSLSPDYAACEEGMAQSPVLIGRTETASLPPLDMHYEPSEATVTRTPLMFEITLRDGGALDREWKLTHIQFHTPGEHRIGERFYPLEIHLIHENHDGARLTVAVMAEIGERLPALDTALKAADDTAFTFDASSLLPPSRGYYAYTGSLTFPPCTEGMQWRVLKTPVQISQAQLGTLGRIVGRNARSIQPLFLRTVQETP